MQDLSGFSDYDGEGGATPKGGRTGGLSNSNSRGFRPPLGNHISPEGHRASSKTLARKGSVSKTGRNSLSGRTDRSDSLSQAGSNVSLNTKDKQRSTSSIPGSKGSSATPPTASKGRRFGTGYALSQQLSADVDANDSTQRISSSQQALQSPATSTTSPNTGSPAQQRSNRTAPTTGSKLPSIRASTPEEDEEDGVRTPTCAEIAGRHIFDEEKSTVLSGGQVVQDESDSSLSEMSLGGGSRDGGAKQGPAPDLSLIHI